MPFRNRHYFGIFALVSLLVLALQGNAQTGVKEQASAAEERRTFIDNTRSIDKAFGFPGTPDRRIDVSVWYPATGEGPWPLIVYSHGTFGYPGNMSHLVEHLVAHGYMVAAPAFPLTSRESFTNIPMAMAADVKNQPADVSFVIDQVLADATLGSRVDAEKIGVMGHSLGAVTGYFLNYGAGVLDDRIKANAMIGAGDPVQAVLSSNFGFVGVQHAPVPVPALFLSAEFDVFARLTGRPFAAYSRVEPPKQEILVSGGTHVWFRDGDDKHPEGRNPDCLFFEKNVPGMVVPGCGETVELIDPALQKEITRYALQKFFDGYLQGNSQALQELHAIKRKFPMLESRAEN